MMMTYTHLSFKSPNGLCNIHDKNAARWPRPTFIGVDRHRPTCRLCHIHDSQAEARLGAAFRVKRLDRGRRRSTKQPINSELSQDASKQSGVERKIPVKDEKEEISEQLIGSVTKGYPASNMQFLGNTETETAASIIVIQLERELKRVPEGGSKVLEMENVRAKYASKLNNINTDDRKKFNTFPVERRPFYTHAFALFCDALESVWLRVSRSSERSGSYFLLGNFAPVEEFGPARVLSVKGELPECLNGEFVRAGPNPKFKPTAGYHWFDGDGMLHGLRIKDGKVTYVSRYVKTSRLAQEEYWGGAKFDRIGDMSGRKGLVAVFLYLLRLGLGVLDKSAGTGTANTALAYHNGTLLTMHEGDKPYAIRVLEDGDFETIARLDYDKKLNHWFTAHPKIDAVTGEMFTFGYRLDRPPYLTYRVVSKDGEMGDPVDITISGPVMMHDFAITENYAIFMDLPLYFSPKDMVMKNQFLFSFDKTKPSRFGVLPRYAKNESQIRWFEFSSCIIFHNANAWEEGDEVVLISCRVPYINLGSMTVDDHAENETSVIKMWEYRFNMKTGEAKERRLGEFGSDFPRINDHYIGRKNRFVYTGLFQDAYHIIGVAKYDLTLAPELGKEKPVVGGNLTGIFWHGHRRYGSEPVFVPRNPGRTGDEDDGYVCSFVFDEHRGVSEVVVIDAKTMSPDPVAVIELPARIPYCFHALHVSEAELQLQKS